MTLATPKTKKKKRNLTKSRMSTYMHLKPKIKVETKTTIKRFLTTSVAKILPKKSHNLYKKLTNCIRNTNEIKI